MFGQALLISRLVYIRVCLAIVGQTIYIYIYIIYIYIHVYIRVLHCIAVK